MEAETANEIEKTLSAAGTDAETTGVRETDSLERNLSLVVNRRASVARILIKYSLSWLRYSLTKFPIKMTLSNLGILAVVLAIILPRAVTYILLYPIFRLVFGNLYPAYASYKAVRTKNVKEYVKWMMYWIVFALFTCAETFTDVFFSFWFPFYYEVKTILVVWLLSPATKGSSILYRRFVHPALIRREAEIDEALARATEQGYTAVLHLGTKGVNYATTVLMQTAIKQIAAIGPNPSSEHIGSQSDSAISSLVNPSQSSASSETIPEKRNCHSGAERRTNPASKRHSRRQDAGQSNAPVDLHDVTTEEETGSETEANLNPQPTFKVPARKSKPRKPRKDRGVPRKVAARACKDAGGRNYDTDVSDNPNFNID